MAAAMTFIFYIVGGIAFIFHEIFSFKYSEEIVSLRDKMTKNKRASLTTWERNFVNQCMVYGIWGIMGLFTSQSILFVGLWLIGISHSYLIRKYLNSKVFILQLDSILSVCMIVFIIFNKCRFHIPMNWKALCGWIGIS
jgi:hypothetical protein